MSAVRFLLLFTALATLALAQDDKVTRGKDLVEEVARCQDCHTPKLQDGTFMKSAAFRGTTLAFAPVIPASAWRAKTPDITPQGALWKRWGEEGFSKFLQTGKGPRGNKADAPMPAYTLRPDDAEAVVAFLKTFAP